ncbi:MAG: hypothetical protein R3E53_19560 [Myxococcota bacterium]
MAYDPELRLLCVGTGNGTPTRAQLRSPQGGDNLYLSSILALRPESGELVWHYRDAGRVLGLHGDPASCSTRTSADRGTPAAGRSATRPKNGFCPMIRPRGRRVPLSHALPGGELGFALRRERSVETDGHRRSFRFVRPKAPTAHIAGRP